MMRKHISDGSVDLAIADVPYFLRGAEEPTVTDFYIQKNGMKPLFNEAWIASTASNSTKHFALRGSTKHCAVLKPRVPYSCSEHSITLDLSTASAK